MISEMILGIFTLITNPSYVTPSSSFDRDIKPIFVRNCTSCHNSRWSDYETVKANASLINKKVVEDMTMPPGSPLSFENRKMIELWIKTGARNN